jgi:hypothetical protein
MGKTDRGRRLVVMPLYANFEMLLERLGNVEFYTGLKKVQYLFPLLISFSIKTSLTLSPLQNY